MKKFKVGSCFVSEEQVNGKRIVRTIVGIENSVIEYENNEDDMTFKFDKETFKFILKYSGSIFAGTFKD